MTISQVKGTTWVLQAQEFIPLVMLEERRCIMLDSGLQDEREKIETALAQQGLTPAGIICSHAHGDHCGNNRYFQQKYHIPVALSPAESHMCSSLLNLKCYFLLLSPQMIEREYSELVHTPDVLLPQEDAPFHILGQRFEVVQTAGHSPAHVALITPDEVCYVGDALVSEGLLGAKLPYALDHRRAGESRKKLLTLSAQLYIMAHRGICTRQQLPELVRGNDEMIARRAVEILSVITHPMPLSEINRAVCQLFSLLTRRPPRALHFERNIRLFVEYLLDLGLVELVCIQGVACYQRTKQSPCVLLGQEIENCR